MFNTLGSFSVVYFALAAVLFVLVLFEKHFIQLEEKYNAKKVKAKKASKTNISKNTIRKKDTKTVRVNRNAAAYRKANKNAA